MTWRRFVVTGTLACVAVAGLAIVDLMRTLTRALELPDRSHDD